jgi:hypothetical protein
MPRFFRRQQGPKGADGGRSTYQELRASALDAVSLGLPAPAAESPDVSGVLVDIPAGDGEFATLVAMCDGTTSLYTSVGGGRIGGGGHAPVAAATRTLLSVVQQHLPSFSSNDDTSHAEARRTRSPRARAARPGRRQPNESPADASAALRSVAIEFARPAAAARGAQLWTTRAEMRRPADPSVKR